MAIHERSASTLSLCAVRMEGSAMTGFGPTLPTWALQQVVSYLRYTGRDANLTAKAARDPNRSYTWPQTRPQFGSEGQSLGGQASTGRIPTRKTSASP
jgi:hypothetical protein